jgi:hypothetical protein
VCDFPYLIVVYNLTLVVHRDVRGRARDGIILGNDQTRGHRRWYGSESGWALPPEPVTTDSVDSVIYFPSMEIANAPTGEQNLHDNSTRKQENEQRSTQMHTITADTDEKNYGDFKRFSNPTKIIAQTN